MSAGQRPSEKVPVVRPGLDEADAAVGVLAQPPRERATGRAGAEHEHVVGHRASPCAATRDPLERGGFPFRSKIPAASLVHRDRVGGTACEREHLAQIGERVAVGVQQVGPLGDGDGLAGQRLGLIVLAAVGADLRAGAAPEHL